MNYEISYSIISQANDAIEVVYSREGFMDVVVSMPAPRVGEDLEAALRMYAPHSAWAAQERAKLPPRTLIGLSGTLSPQTPMTTQGVSMTAGTTPIDVTETTL